MHLRSLVSGVVTMGVLAACGNPSGPEGFCGDDTCIGVRNATQSHSIMEVLFSPCGVVSGRRAFSSASCISA